jgi:hypothetical protein
MEAATSDVSLSQMEALVKKLLELDGKIEANKREVLKPLQEEYAKIEEQIKTALESQELTSYRSKVGLITRVNRYSVRNPESTDAKKEFYKYLKNQGDDIFWDFVTPNNQKLNAYYKEQREIAKEKGDFDFSLPGIGEPKLSSYLSIKKG